MRKTRFSEEQIINILKGVEAGQRVADACEAVSVLAFGGLPGLRSSTSMKSSSSTTSVRPKR
ncbi:MAG TPA: transposase [Pyrinomonadaceae bacterium]